MRLTFKDRQEIEAIIKGFGEAEHEQIRQLVEQQVESQKHNPIEAAMTLFFAKQGDDMDMVGRAQDDCDAQEMAHKFLWDYVTKIEEQRLGESIWKARHSYREVA
ncbi:hypothetical protein [Pantoea sp. BAV 3049]|uniref:hypothetical protein n=1 Tax=Pantoea sp. BAV 3049 TaxID=2654188 RepID=UPI00131CD128|nr:hypothetical protein [Pantoea sp. BAV 3049]